MTTLPARHILSDPQTKQRNQSHAVIWREDLRPHRHGKTARGRLHQIYNDKQLFEEDHQALT
jgi:hypothetical protein